ncbi:tyrosine-type recombinase/integrase [Vibrio campbellii]|uniref:tyrosine-type recombinase/integrase n=1 Tax=Vibrio campbellii TaxID=680 RepID=UPI00210D7661|nr:tyrosine-type recombinase/integrase [Vibrio campbellii]UTZ44554.1 tyrosine-type recombinase/integrase [Vibrio campbellii]
MAQPITCMKQWQQILDFMDRRCTLVSMMIEFESRTGLRYADASQLKFTDVLVNGKPRDSFEVVQSKSYKMRLDRIAKNEALALAEIDVLASSGAFTDKEIDKKRSELASKMKKKRSQAKVDSKVVIGVSDSLKELIMQIHDYNGEYKLMFQSRHHHAKPDKPITRRYVNQQLKLVGQEVGVNFDLSSHSMRKTFATLLMNKKVNTKTISALLGHSSVAVTDNYLHSCRNEQIEVVANLDFGMTKKLTGQQLEFAKTLLAGGHTKEQVCDLLKCDVDALEALV